MVDRGCESENAERDALRALGRSAKSEAALRSLLLRRYPVATVDQVLAELRRAGWLDDTKAARVLAERLVERELLAPTAVRARLLGRGFDEATADAALAALDIDEVRGLAALAARLPFDPRHPQRLAARLARAGYDGDAIAELIARQIERAVDD